MLRDLIDAVNDGRFIEFVNLRANPALTDGINIFIEHVRNNGAQNSAQDNLNFLTHLINSLEYWAQADIFIDGVAHLIVIADSREYAQFMEIKEGIGREEVSSSFRCAPAA